MIESIDSIAGIEMTCGEKRGSAVINVLICDDDKIFLEKMNNNVSGILESLNAHAKIRTFQNGDIIAGPVIASCDIAILDVELGEGIDSGLEIAARIHAARPDAVIIFVTNFISYAVAGYEVRAFRYLLKKDMEKQLGNYIQAALEELSVRRETLKISVNGEIIDIPLNNILYLTSQAHTVIVYAISRSNPNSIKQYRYYASLQSVEQQLSKRGFLRIHKSYLVNMQHIKKFQYEAVTLKNGETLPVSEKNYAKLKNAFLLWRGK